MLINLATKGIQTSCVCPIVDDEPESLLHALISYDFALSMWSLWNDCPIDIMLKAKDFNEVVLQLCSNLVAMFLEFFFVISW